MSFKVVVTLTAVFFAYCNASTLPEILDANTLPQEVDADTLPQAVDAVTLPQAVDAVTLPQAVDSQILPQPLDAEIPVKLEDPTFLPIPLPTTNQVEGTNIQQCGETTNQFGDASRVTCDLFASEPLCAAHCLLLGYSGGFCNAQKVCVCRRSIQNDELTPARAPCGGGCVTSSQCAAYAGNTNCRCAWFTCSRYTVNDDLTDLQQFETFIKEYSGNSAMISSAEKAFRQRQ